MVLPTDALRSVPDDITLWKYLNFRKFVSVLEMKALYFPNPSQFDDPYEGRIPGALLNALPTRTQRNQFVDMLDAMQSSVAVDCWHYNEYESEAMWKIYSGEKGLSIRTTAGDLRRSLGNQELFEVRWVQYIDYDNPGVLENFDIYLPYQCKRKSFEHEKEVRVITRDIESGASGRYCEIDVNALIGEVFVAPDSEDWFRDLVGSVMNRYEISRKVQRSTLANRPAP